MRCATGSGTLPASGGTPATVIVTMTLTDLLARINKGEKATSAGAGLVHTEFGGVMSIDRLLKYAAECEYIPVVLGDGGGVLAYGSVPRVATAAQTTALIARDHGCSLPGCTVPASWSERHHVTPHHLGGPTSLDNLTLVCRWHHRQFEKFGWECVFIDGRPHWRPPEHIDAERRPRRNVHWDTRFA